jgi:hypothetical protein
MKRFIFVFVLLTLIPAAAWAQFSYAPINVPGAVSTQARGINNNGEIVGFYQTTTCNDYYVNVVPTCPSKGFKYVNGSYVKLMVPGSVSTVINGVNDYGDLVGFYKKSGGSIHGFIWYHQNVVKTIDYPHPGWPTIPLGINKAGTVVGAIWGPGSQYPSYGWVWVNGKFSNMDPYEPDYPPPTACCWSVNGISNNGIIVGQGFSHDWNKGWLKQGTDEDFFMNTPAGNNGADTFPTGVNSATDVVGYNWEGWFAKHIELNEGTNDATEVSPTFIKIAFPGGSYTTPYAVNDKRAVVGAYTNSTGTHGFLAKANF